MELEVGKAYINRMGLCILIMGKDKWTDSYSHPYWDEEGHTYMSDGSYLDPTTESPFDLVKVA